MGVKGLEYYIESHCPSACHHVSIAFMANEHRRIYNTRPILAVDGMSVLHRLYKKDNLEWLYGGQWKQYVECFLAFVNRFKEEDIELVFFFDGTPEPIKTNEWINRRIEKLKDIKIVFQHIHNYQTHPDERMSQLPASMGSLVRYALKYICNCQVVNTIVDADKEIAKYALSTISCFAILSQDSDYIIFDTKPYLSVKHLEVGPLETVLYDRTAFANSIGLNVPQLPLFACLMGNDFVSIDSVRSLHRYLTSTRGYTKTAAVVPKAAQFILQYNWTGGLHNDYLLHEIAENTGLSEDILSIGIDYYFLLRDLIERRPITAGIIPPNILTKVRQKHRNCELNPHIYSLMCHLEFKSSECLEDQEMTGLMPSCIIFREMRQRWYAILFGTDAVEVSELSAIQGVPILNEKIKPEMFSVYGTKQPDLSVLWDYNSHKTILWTTFLAGLGSAISEEQLRDIPIRYGPFACLLNYLLLHPIGEPRLFSWEVDALVAQIVSPVAEDSGAIRALTVPHVDPRAVHLATILMRGVAGIIGFNQVCGEPFPPKWTMPWNCFDGKLFHVLYIMAMRGASVEELLLNDVAAVKEFVKLRSVCISGTYILQERYRNMQ